MGRSTVELIAFALVFAAVASIAHGIGYRNYVKPLLDKKTRVRAQSSRVYQSKTWVRNLNVRVRQAERKGKMLQSVLDELATYTLRDEGDRLRISMARDHASKDLPGLVVTPAEVSPPVPLTFHVPVDPNEQLNRLKQPFAQENPRVAFPNWVVPSSIEVKRFSERVTVEAPLPQVMRFLMRVEAEPLLIHVTELKLKLPDPDQVESNIAVAQVELSALAFPAEESSESH